MLISDKRKIRQVKCFFNCLSKYFQQLKSPHTSLPKISDVDYRLRMGKDKPTQISELEKFKSFK